MIVIQCDCCCSDDCGSDDDCSDDCCSDDCCSDDCCSDDDCCSECCSDDYLKRDASWGFDSPQPKKRLSWNWMIYMLSFEDLHFLLHTQCCLLAHSLSTVNLSIHHSVDLSTLLMLPNRQSNLSIYQSINLSICSSVDPVVQ
jgi:hypothetical protein